MSEHDKLFMTNTARDAGGSQMTLELIYRVFYRMIFIIQRVWIKACSEDCFFDWIWISTAHIVSTSCEAVWHVTMYVKLHENRIISQILL